MKWWYLWIGLTIGVLIAYALGMYAWISFIGWLFGAPTFSEKFKKWFKK